MWVGMAHDKVNNVGWEAVDEQGEVRNQIKGQTQITELLGGPNNIFLLWG